MLHLCQQQEVIEQEAVQLFAALGFEQLPTVEELPGTQTVGDRVKDELLKDTEEKRIIQMIDHSGEWDWRPVTMASVSVLQYLRKAFTLDVSLNPLQTI